ncbi:MAG TPA: XrtA system polysaccharide deacetylase [Gemmatimonadales bacterium]|nr:XrtA system polysaccharide deacetylase [Gemmatimonadales bacterium]
MLVQEPLPVQTSAAHIFSVDVEDYFQVVAFEKVVDRADWDRYPSRVVSNTERLLDLLEQRQVRGTFFTLGWVGRRFPDLVRRIARVGHEIASHGLWHRRITTLTPDQFRSELRESKRILEDASGQACVGFRAPSFSIVPGYEWAFDVLVEEGYRYDSSLFPIRRPDYGYPDAAATPFWIRRPAGALLELPLATLVTAGLRLPAAGGAYFRQLPRGLVRRAFRQWGRRGVSAMFYIHPWEYDTDQPRLPCGRLTALRHYRNLDRTWSRLEQLLTEFRFTSVADRFGPELEPRLPILGGTR